MQTLTTKTIKPPTLKQVSKRLLSLFGETFDHRECGFILPDGTMIDLSDGQKGFRTVEHSYAIASLDIRYFYLAHARELGIARVQFSRDGWVFVNISKPLTNAQMDAICGYSQITGITIDPDDDKCETTRHVCEDVFSQREVRSKLLWANGAYSS